jgi:hypothetical protein
MHTLLNNLFKEESMKVLCVLFTTLLFSLSLGIQAATIVISDIDDTVKKTYSLGGLKVVKHFLKSNSFKDMQAIYQELDEDHAQNGEEIYFFYVSGSYKFYFNGRKWLEKKGFRVDGIDQKKISSSKDTYKFKYEKITELLGTLPEGDHKFLMFGDNSDADDRVYNDITNDNGLDSEIFIRDVQTFSNVWSNYVLDTTSVENVKYFMSAWDLIKYDTFLYISPELESQIRTKIGDRDLIPKYVLKQRAKVYDKYFGCKKKSKLKFWKKNKKYKKCHKQSKEAASQDWEAKYNDWGV